MAGNAEAAKELAARLRRLRTKGIPGAAITQSDLAKALDVSVPLVSSWESQSHPATPPEPRLIAYAQLFCTSRSLTDGRLRRLPVDRFTPDEEDRYHSLERELIDLRRTAVGDQPTATLSVGPWHFPTGQDITLICAPLPDDFVHRMPYHHPGDPDHVELYRYADLDALVELHGHIRAANPATDVYIKLATELEADDYTSHLVLLGGVDWNVMTRDLLDRVELPVKQRPSSVDNPYGAAFEVSEDGRVTEFAPSLTDRSDGTKRLVEDVAHFFRVPSPFNRRRTVSMCNGIFGRGTLGAVRTLTDKRFRDTNAEHIRDRFADGDTFSVLSRVQVVRGQVVTPDWTVPGNVLHEWPGKVS